MATNNLPSLNSIMVEMIADMKKICREQKTPTTWRKKYVYAVPYIDAILTINSINDRYGFDTGRGLVNYLLANLNTYKGETAKRLKGLLKEHLKG